MKIFKLHSIAVFFLGCFIGACVLILALNRAIDYNEEDRGRAHRLLQGRIISAGLRLWAEENNGSYPESFEELKPKYVGNSVQTKDFKLIVSEKKWKGANDHRVVAIEIAKDKQEMTVVIRADGVAYVTSASD